MSVCCFSVYCFFVHHLDLLNGEKYYLACLSLFVVDYWNHDKQVVFAIFSLLLIIQYCLRYLKLCV